MSQQASFLSDHGNSTLPCGQVRAGPSTTSSVYSQEQTRTVKQLTIPEKNRGIWFRLPESILRFVPLTLGNRSMIALSTIYDGKEVGRWIVFVHSRGDGPEPWLGTLELGRRAGLARNRLGSYHPRFHHLLAAFGVRFHPVEIVISTAVKALSILVLGMAPLAVVIFEIVLNSTALFNHGNVRIPVSFDRVLRWVIVTPDMHRIHHSTDVQEINSNYGFNVPWWDRLFGTYCP